MFAILCRTPASSSSIMNPAETSIATRPRSKTNHVCRYRAAIALTHRFTSGTKRAAATDFQARVGTRCLKDALHEEASGKTQVNVLRSVACSENPPRSPRDYNVDPTAEAVSHKCCSELQSARKLKKPMQKRAGQHGWQLWELEKASA